MEKQQNSPHSIGSLSTNSISGPASAWNIAFNDLKRRYLISQYNVGILKEERGKITIELCRATDQLELFKKENEQLNISVADKNSAYSKLEELYKQQTKSAQRSEEYSKELFQKVQKLASEKISYENELNKAIDENEKLSRLHEKLVKENAQLKEELDSWKNVPEVTVRKDNDNAHTSSIDDKDKEMQGLISENKGLKTNLHWLSEEVKRLKSEKYSSPVRNTHNINGCLEEGINNFGLNKNYPQDVKTMNLRTYIQLLHNTINHLKSAMSSQLAVSKEIIASRLGPRNDFTPSLFSNSDGESRDTRADKEHPRVIQIYEQHKYNNPSSSREPLSTREELFRGETLMESNAKKKQEHMKQFPNLWRTDTNHTTNTENMNYAVQSAKPVYQPPPQQLVQPSNQQHQNSPQPGIPSPHYMATLLQQNYNNATPALISADVGNAGGIQQQPIDANVLVSPPPAAVDDDNPSPIYWNTRQDECAKLPPIFHHVQQVQTKTYLTNSNPPPDSP